MEFIHLFQFQRVVNMLKLIVVLGVCLLAVNANFVSFSFRNAVDETSPAAVAENVFFYLYNQPGHHGTHEAGHQLFLSDASTFQNTNIDPSKPLIILVHGFIQRHSCGFPQDIKDAYLELNQGINVITVDWGVHACAEHATSELLALACYPTAILKVASVGQAISDLIWELVQQGLTSADKVRIIGASMGAHVSGEAGSRFQKDHGQTISRITALDPGGPAFTCGGARCLSKTDALFVDAMHTDMGALGTTQALGHVDYYPNGGGHPQPTCEGQKDECSHGTCAQYWLHSIGRTDILAYECSSYGDFTNGTCGEGRTAAIVFGDSAQPGQFGAFYLNIVPKSFSGRYKCYQ